MGTFITLLIVLLVLPSMSGSIFELLDVEPAFVQWYGLAVPSQLFAPAFCAAYAAWALFGARQLMRSELLERNSPWWWAAFLLFVQIHLAGLVTAGTAGEPGVVGAVSSGIHGSSALAAVGVAAALPLVFAYAFVFGEPKPRVQLAKLLDSWRAGQLAAAFALSPLWLRSLLHACVTLPLAIAVAFVLLDAPQAFAFAAGSLAVLLFALRDIAIVLACNSGASQRRADTAALVYLLLLYALLPSVLALIGLEGALGFVLPFFAFVQPAWALVAVPWLGAGLWLLRVRWRQGAAALAATAGGDGRG